MAGQIYFGNTEYQTWIKAPNTGMQAGSAGYVSQHQLYNGRAYVRRSHASHRTFSPNWMGSLNSTENSLQTIKNFADGFYGKGPFYWVDPFAANRNILPPHWASPAMITTDWPDYIPSLTKFYNPESSTTGFPSRYVAITNTDSTVESNQRVRLIIPQGYTLHFGWFKPTGGDPVGFANPMRIDAYTRGANTYNAITPTGIVIGSTTDLTNTTVDGDDYSSVDLYLNVLGGSKANILAMIAQILPTGVSAPTGNFIAGMGTTALEFNNSPQIEYYSANINNGQVGMSASLVEVN
jgi:hypothetical protein